MNESMIEKVAKAIYDSHQFKKDWNHTDTKRLWHDCMRAEARAAIKAMMEPTDEMLVAASGIGPIFIDGIENVDDTNREIWQAMVQEMLQEPPEQQD